MFAFAENFEFEAAQDIKTRIELLERYQAKSTIVSPTIHQVDVVTMVEDNDTVFVNYLVVNSGAIIHGITVEVKRKLDETQNDILTFVLPELRERFQSTTKEILVENPLDWEMED
jgi:excinuclease ABC subunit C